MQIGTATAFRPQVFPSSNLGPPTKIRAFAQQVVP